MKSQYFVVIKSQYFVDQTTLSGVFESYSSVWYIIDKFAILDNTKKSLSKQSCCFFT